MTDHVRVAVIGGGIVGAGSFPSPRSGAWKEAAA